MAAQPAPIPSRHSATTTERWRSGRSSIAACGTRPVGKERCTAVPPGRTPPLLGLMFTNEDVARKIFAGWRERFGIGGQGRRNPHLHRARYLGRASSPLRGHDHVDAGGARRADRYRQRHLRQPHTAHARRLERQPGEIPVRIPVRGPLRAFARRSPTRRTGARLGPSYREAQTHCEAGGRDRSRRYRKVRRSRCPWNSKEGQFGSPSIMAETAGGGDVRFGGAAQLGPMAVMGAEQPVLLTETEWQLRQQDRTWPANREGPRRVGKHHSKLTSRSVVNRAAQRPNAFVSAPGRGRANRSAKRRYLQSSMT